MPIPTSARRWCHEALSNESVWSHPHPTGKQHSRRGRSRWLLCLAVSSAAATTVPAASACPSVEQKRKHVPRTRPPRYGRVATLWEARRSRGALRAHSRSGGSGSTSREQEAMHVRFRAGANGITGLGRMPHARVPVSRQSAAEDMGTPRSSSPCQKARHAEGYLCLRSKEVGSQSGWGGRQREARHLAVALRHWELGAEHPSVKVVYPSTRTGLRP